MNDMDRRRFLQMAPMMPFIVSNVKAEAPFEFVGTCRNCRRYLYCPRFPNEDRFLDSCPCPENAGILHRGRFEREILVGVYCPFGKERDTYLPLETAELRPVNITKGAGQ